MTRLASTPDEAAGLGSFQFTTTANIPLSCLNKTDKCCRWMPG